MCADTPVVHSVQAYRSKYWVAYPTLVLGALIEVLGWSARLWSHYNVTLLTPFLMQICTLIMAPVFFSAYDYIILGIAIRKLGPQYSLLRPSWYLIVFLTADIISCILQAIGGGKASASAGEGAPSQNATDIMVAGIIFQLISMAVFVVLGFLFIFRATSRKPYAFRERQIAAKREKQAAKAAASSLEKGLAHRDSDTTIAPTSSDATAVHANGAIKSGEVVDGEEQIEARQNLKRWWIMLGGCLVSSIAIVVRGIFRSIELSHGWESRLATTEVYQVALDGAMMVVAVGVFNISNPVWLLPKRAVWKGFH